ncbi:hypothetical protein SAMN02927928_1825 [Asticcacaulis taihuensis]|uniref:Uncharacterized protein n=1 Tax=Asticcacaulis taihuensis TaxID=260084 RepID=A0A1G4REA5_9CAUL|nr:hypothetical protein SAMN02927928_1825 [Asticcacaulis taihuensis]
MVVGFLACFLQKPVRRDRQAATFLSKIPHHPALRARSPSPSKMGRYKKLFALCGAFQRQQADAVCNGFHVAVNFGGG